MQLTRARAWRWQMLAKPRDVELNACAFVTTMLDVGFDPARDDIPVLLPVFGPDASRYFRCWAVREFVASQRSTDLADSLARACVRTGAVPLQGALRRRFTAWLRAEPKWTTAAQRASQLSFDTAPPLLLHANRSLWQSLVPADIGFLRKAGVGRDVQLPPPAFHLSYTLFAMVTPEGKTVNVKAREAYYPRRAPRAAAELLIGADEAAVRAYDVSLGAGSDRMWHTCLAAAGEMFHMKMWRARLCGRGSAHAVARVFVLTTAHMDRLTRVYLELLPRLGPLVDWLARDETVTVHAHCPDRPSLCLAVLQGLGVPSERVLATHRAVFAYEALVPQHSDDPMAAAWGLHAARRKLVPRALLLWSALPPPLPTQQLRNDNGKSGCPSLENGARVVVLQRDADELRPIGAAWHVALARALAADPLVAPLNLSVSLLDVSDLAVMRDARAVAAALQRADVLVGAHGDGLALIALARTCAKVVAVRTLASNSRFEHAALATGYA